MEQPYRRRTSALPHDPTLSSRQRMLDPHRRQQRRPSARPLKPTRQPYEKESTNGRCATPPRAGLLGLGSLDRAEGRARAPSNSTWMAQPPQRAKTWKMCQCFGPENAATSFSSSITSTISKEESSPSTSLRLWKRSAQGRPSGAPRAPGTYGPDLEPLCCFVVHHGSQASTCGRLAIDRKDPPTPLKELQGLQT
jgi:hypothetical protein